MNVVSLTNRLVRSPGDPKVEQTGPSSVSPSDTLARALGWFSLALGLMEVVAPERVTRLLGLPGKEGLVRAYGAREIMAGVPTLSMDKHVGLASRVAGDVLDIATLLPALRAGNAKRGNAALALAAVTAVTVLDVIALAAVANEGRRDRGRTLDYGDRSGLPKGVQASRGLARRTDPPQRAAA
jgi:hypothetical protein